MKRRVRALVLFLLFFSIWSTVAERGAAFAQGRKIRLAWVAVSGAMAPVWIAQELNLYKKYGLDAELLFVGGSSLATRALLTGDLDITVNSGLSVVNAAATEALDIVLVAGISNVLPFYLMARSGFKTSDLKGKVIATDKPGTAPYHALTLTLKHLHLTPRDVRITPVGPPPTVLAAMEQRIVDVGILSPPMSFRAESLGFQNLVDIASLGIYSQGVCIATTRRFIKDHREEVLKFMKALVAAINVYKTDPDVALRVLEKYTKIRDWKILERTRRYYAEKIIPQLPYPTREGLQAVVEDQAAMNPVIASVKVDDLIDNSFLSELEKSGFIQAIYRK
jgi:ABC-type nitrate/sulfonate/bicarbonate transport system substrate-binding protein